MRFTVEYEYRGATYYQRNLTGRQVAMYKRRYYVYSVKRTK